MFVKQSVTNIEKMEKIKPTFFSESHAAVNDDITHHVSIFKKMMSPYRQKVIS